MSFGTQSRWRTCWCINAPTILLFGTPPFFSASPTAHLSILQVLSRLSSTSSVFKVSLTFLQPVEGCLQSKQQPSFSFMNFFSTQATVLPFSRVYFLINHTHTYTYSINQPIKCSPVRCAFTVEVKRTASGLLRRNTTGWLWLLYARYIAISEMAKMINLLGRPTVTLLNIGRHHNVYCQNGHGIFVEMLVLGD